MWSSSDIPKHYTCIHMCVHVKYCILKHDTYIHTLHTYIQTIREMRCRIICLTLRHLATSNIILNTLCRTLCSSLSAKDDVIMVELKVNALQYSSKCKSQVLSLALMS